MIAERKSNSFDLLRIIFAFFVIITHSHTLTENSEDDLITKITNGHYHFSEIAVNGFFAISGFLVVQSLNTTNSIKNFLLKRFFRIYPALTVVLLLTVSLGWIVYTGTFDQYIHDRNVYTYFFKNLLLIGKPFIFGIFDNNHAGNVINVSLWTLPYEVALYFSLLSFYFIPLKSQPYAALSIQLLAVITILFSSYFPILTNAQVGALRIAKLLETSTFFYGGVFLGTLPNAVFSRNKIFIFIALAIILLVSYLPLPLILFNVALPFFVIGLGSLTPHKWLNNFLHLTGDISFGIYIYAFPVQQTLIYYYQLNFWQLLVLTGIISILFGYLSWHLIEKKAHLYIKNKIRYHKNNKTGLYI